MIRLESFAVDGVTDASAFEPLVGQEWPIHGRVFGDSRRLEVPLEFSISVGDAPASVTEVPGVGLLVMEGRVGDGGWLRMSYRIDADPLETLGVDCTSDRTALTGGARLSGTGTLTCTFDFGSGAEPGTLPFTATFVVPAGDAAD